MHQYHSTSRRIAEYEYLSTLFVSTFQFKYLLSCISNNADSCVLNCRYVFLGKGVVGGGDDEEEEEEEEKVQIQRQDFHHLGTAT